MSDRPSCPPPELLCQLIDGKIEDPVMTDLTRHLDACPACQSRVPTLLSTDTLVNSLRGDSTVTERMLADVPQPLIDALLRIPVLDSSDKLSADGLSQNRGMTLDDLGLSFLTPPQAPDEIGRLGHYRILRVLGRGGMGIVFLAEDPKLGREVALKVILPRIANIPAARDRFLREAKAAASLKSDYIVTVYQVDEVNGLPFLAMELLQGETLDQSLRAGRRFSISETVQIAHDVAKGLAEAHSKGLVHRDIKPANLWLEQSPEGKLRVKILDFGLARAEREDVHLTEFGTIVGTPAFMSPEQGHADRPIDSRADLFALGSVLYVLCTGEMPFQAETTVGILMALALKNPVPPAKRNDSVPPELSELTMQLLEKEPGDRPQSARDVLDRLQRLRTSIDSTETQTSLSRETLLGVSKPISSVPRAAAPRPRKSVGRGWRIGLGIGFAALLLIAAQVYLWQTRDGQIVRIECNDPTIKLAFEGGDLNVIGAYDQPVKLTPGKVDLKITKPQLSGKDFVFETNKLVVRKNDQIALKIEVLDAEIRIVRDGQVVDSKAFTSSAELFAALVDSMKKANPGFDGAMVPVFEGELLVSLDFRTDFVTDLSPLRKARHLRGLRMDGDSSLDRGISDLSPLQGLPLTGLYVYNNARLRDLSPLRGMQLQELHTDGCPIADFAPLTGMPLRVLKAWSWTGSDLSPLQGMPLTEINVGGSGKALDLSPLAGAPLEFLCCNYTGVSDLSPLRGMPLKTLFCEGTHVSDLSPLLDAPLRDIAAGKCPITDFSVLARLPMEWAKFDIVPERDLPVLRKINSLVRINDQRAVDFLRETSDQMAPRPIPPAFTNSLGMELR